MNMYFSYLCIIIIYLQFIYLIEYTLKNIFLTIIFYIYYFYDCALRAYELAGPRRRSMRFSNNNFLSSNHVTLFLFHAGERYGRLLFLFPCSAFSRSSSCIGRLTSRLVRESTNMSPRQLKACRLVD